MKALSLLLLILTISSAHSLEIPKVGDTIYATDTVTDNWSLPFRTHPPSQGTFNLPGETNGNYVKINEPYVVLAIDYSPRFFSLDVWMLLMPLSRVNSLLSTYDVENLEDLPLSLLSSWSEGWVFTGVAHRQFSNHYAEDVRFAPNFWGSMDNLEGVTLEF